MPKLSPDSIFVGSVKNFDFVIKGEGSNEGKDIALTLRYLRYNEALAAESMSRDAYRTYVTGDPETGVRAIPLDPVADRPVYVSMLTCRACAALAIAQIQPIDERYSLEELLRFTIAPEYLTGIVEAFKALTVSGAEEVGDDESPLAGTAEES